MKKLDLKDATMLCGVMLRTEPRRPGAQDFDVMDNRQYILDALYVIDGRGKPLHPKRGLYTGLWKKYVKA